MLTNDQMTAGRWLRFHRARKTVAAIEATLMDGRAVYVCTYTRATKYTKKHAGMFKATKTGVYVQRGKHWDSLMGCKITTD